jgi:voltage-gated potassium channel
MLKNKLRNILESDNLNSKEKVIFDLFISFLIVLSVMFIFIENKNGDLPEELILIDQIVNIIFIIEFVARFYVSTNFIEEYRNSGLVYALRNKIKWFFKRRTLIDFLAIIPAVEFFRIFRTLRFVKLLRLLRIYKSVRFFKEFDKFVNVLRGMKEENRVFFVFFNFTLVIVTFISFALYVVEHNHADTEFSSFGNSLWYSIKVIGFGDEHPDTVLGKIFAGMLLFANMAIFGFFISIIISKVQTIMDSFTNGKIKNINMEDHIIICGYTKSSMNVIADLLTERENINNIVLVTTKEYKDDLGGVIYVNADFTEVKTLLDLNISKAKFAIVFAEPRPHDTTKDVDLRTVITIFNIEKEASHVHTIAEINDESNAEIIKDKIDGDEILYKEMIDSKIISACIKHKHVSNIFYKLFDTSKDQRLEETTKKSLELDKKEVTIKDIKYYFIEKDCSFLGLIDANNESKLSPPNSMIVDDSMRLIYIKN